MYSLFFDPQAQNKNDYFFSPATVQPKLTIGQPGDKYEQEADAVADKVVENISESSTQAKETPNSLNELASSQAAASTNMQPAVQAEKEEAQEELKQESPENEVQRKPIFESENEKGQDQVQPKLKSDAPLLQKQAEEEEQTQEELDQQTKEITAESGAEENPEDNPSEEEGGSGEGDPGAGADPTETETGEMETDTNALKEEAANSVEEISNTNELSTIETESEAETQTSDSSKEENNTPEAEKATSTKDEKAAEEASSGAAPPSESKMKENLADKAGEPVQEKKEKAIGETTGGDSKKVNIDKEDSDAEGKTTQIAEATASKKKVSEGGKEEDLGSKEVPIKTEAPALPEPGDKILDKKPAPLTLGISESQQRNLILAKGATEEEVPAELGNTLQQSKGSGQSLDESTSQEMGQQIGADFSGVKIHTDNQAQSMNQDIGAKAFTHGKDIYFNSGQYNPASTEGKRLLAHELTHTIQQGAVSSVSPKLEENDAPQVQSKQETPAIQRSALGALGAVAKAAAVEGAKFAIKQLGEFAMKRILEHITGVKGDKNKKAGDWKTQLTSMGREFLTGERSAEDKLAQSKAQAEEATSIKKGTEDVNKAKADPLPEGLMTLIQAVLNYGNAGGGQSGAFGTDKEAEEQGVEQGVQEDASGWEQINAMTNELAPLAGENEEEVKQVVSSIGKLKESNWRSLKDWMGLFEASKGIIPGLGDLMQKGKQALSTGINTLKGMLGENATQLWERGSKLANAFLSGSGSFQERALRTAQEMGQQMQTDADKEGKKVLGKAKGTEKQGGTLMKALQLLSDERAMKVFELVSNAIRSAITIIRGLGSSGQAVQGTFDGVKEQVNRGKRILQRIIQKIRQFIAKVRAAIVRMMKRAWEFIKRTVKRAIEAAKRLLKRIWAKIKELVKRAIAKAKELLKKLTDKIKAFLKPALDWLKRKIITPIKNMIKRAKKKIQDWWKKWKEKRKKKAGIRKALRDIESKGKAELDEGEVTRIEADDIKKQVNQKHAEAINITSIKESEDNWDFEYIQKKKKSIPKGRRPILTEDTILSYGNPATSSPLTRKALTIGNSSRAEFDTWKNLATPVNMAFDPPGTKVRGQKGPWVRGHIIHFSLGGDGSKKENILIIDRKANEAMSSKFETPAINKLKSLIRRAKAEEKQKVMYYKVQYTTWGTSKPLIDFGKNFNIEFGLMNKDGSDPTPIKTSPTIQSRTTPPTDPGNLTVDIRGMGRTNIARLLGDKGIIAEFAHYLSFTMGSTAFRKKSSLHETLRRPRNIAAYRDQTGRPIALETARSQADILNGIIDENFSFKLGD